MQDINWRENEKIKDISKNVHTNIFCSWNNNYISSFISFFLSFLKHIWRREKKRFIIWQMKFLVIWNGKEIKYIEQTLELYSKSSEIKAFIKEKNNKNEIQIKR